MRPERAGIHASNGIAKRSAYLCSALLRVLRGRAADLRLPDRAGHCRRSAPAQPCARLRNGGGAPPTRPSCAADAARTVLVIVRRTSASPAAAPDRPHRRDQETSGRRAAAGGAPPPQPPVRPAIPRERCEPRANAGSAKTPREPPKPSLLEVYTKWQPQDRVYSRQTPLTLPRHPPDPPSARRTL